MSKFGQGVRHFIVELIPPFIYFFVAFQLITFTNALLLRQYGIDVTRFVVASIGALVAAKVVVLSDLLPFINRFPGKPIIYNIVWKTPIYFLVAFVVRYIEALIDFYRHNDTLLGANRRMVEGVIWPHFWAIQIWLMVLLLIYCTMDALVQAVGRDKIRELFFGISGKAVHKAN
ncbi:MAG: hypothetical protein WBR29_04480 [Gammaproteobacteria bacterium]